MTDESKPTNPECGWARLWHPRGTLVTLPIRDVTPAGSLALVSAFLDAGWLVQAPGLEEGEEKDSVGWVLRGSHEKDGEVTPTLILYPADERKVYPLLKVYLNNDTEVAAFEYASKMKLNDLPECLVDKGPERGANSKTDKFIVRAAKPFGVVFKKNPKHDPHEQDVKKKKPARLFVRWADERPAPAQAAPAGERTPGPILGGVERLNDAEAAELVRMLNASMADKPAFCNYYQIAKPADLPVVKLKEATGHLTRKAAR